MSEWEPRSYEYEFTYIIVGWDLKDCKTEEDFINLLLKYSTPNEIKAVKELVEIQYPKFQKKLNQLMAFK